MNAELGHACFVEHHALVHQIHPVVHLHIQHRAVDGQGQCVAPVERIAFGEAAREIWGQISAINRKVWN